MRAARMSEDDMVRYRYEVQFRLGDTFSQGVAQFRPDRHVAISMKDADRHAQLIETRRVIDTGKSTTVTERPQPQPKEFVVR